MKAIYQLKIEINGSQPPIWRRIQVVNNVTFSELHDLIQITFGWNAEHEYEFVVNKTRIYDFEEKIDTGDNPGERDSMDTVLEEYLNMVNTRFTYTYDFEDRWKHTVIFEKVLVGDDSNVGYCTCIAGERACPPEDCGGIRSYQNMLNVLEDKGHPQHESTKELLGEDWDSRSFDIKNTNDFLRQYAEEWEEIFNETGEIIEQMEESENSVEDWDDIESDLSEYESLYPDVDTPICLRRGTWREEMEGKEERFYYDDAPFDEFDFPSGYYSSQKLPGFFRLPDKQGTIIKEKMPSRNDPCPCGSGKKYKKCCLDKDMD